MQIDELREPACARARASRARRTVLVVAWQGFAFRYILRTDVLRVLSEEARVVVMTPNAGESYLEEEFGADEIAFELLRVSNEPSRGLQLLFRTLRQYTLAGGARATTLRTKYDGFIRELAGGRPFGARLLGLAIRALWRSRGLRRLLVAVESRLFPYRLHDDVFERWRPDLVLTTSPGYFEPDAAMLRAARRHRVRSVALIMGWDNPSSKGYRGAMPDRGVAWSNRMADQLARFQDMPRERIDIGGVPHWDLYRRPGELHPRQEVFADLGLDSSRRTVLFATASPRTYAHHLVVVRTVAEAIENGSIRADAQLVVRLHPLNFGPAFEADLEEYERVAQAHEHVHLNVPRVQSRRLPYDMPSEENVSLASLLAHSDLLLNVFSTMTLEACLLDKPVVLVGSRAHQSVEGARADKVVHRGTYRALDFDSYTHQASVVVEGAARIARSMSEVVELVGAYLQDPAMDRDARQRVADLECGPADGRAGERTGRLIAAVAAAIVR